MEKNERTGIVYQQLATMTDAYHRCATTNKPEWRDRWANRLDKLVCDTAPSGSGFDDSVELVLDKSNGHDRMEFYTEYHFMNEGGYYDGWATFRIVVKPTLMFGVDIRVTTSKKHVPSYAWDIREYVGSVFGEWLESQVTETYNRETDTCSYRLVRD